MEAVHYYCSDCGENYSDRELYLEHWRVKIVLKSIDNDPARLQMDIKDIQQIDLSGEIKQTLFDEDGAKYENNSHNVENHESESFAFEDHIQPKDKTIFYCG